MSLAALQPPVAIFREEQFFDWRVYTGLALVAVGPWIALACGIGRPPGPPMSPVTLWPEIPIGLAAGLVGPAQFMLRMTTEVTPTDLRVWFGWSPSNRRYVDLAAIATVEVVRYRPIRDYGSWGVRLGPDGERAYTARGDRGVRLLLADGTRVLIGSQQPEALARALESSIRRVD